jgi:hypothetical protein
MKSVKFYDKKGLSFILKVLAPGCDPAGWDSRQGNFCYWCSLANPGRKLHRLSGLSLTGMGRLFIFKGGSRDFSADGGFSAQGRGAKNGRDKISLFSFGKKNVRIKQFKKSGNVNENLIVA